jgi:hypothetical protein
MGKINTRFRDENSIGPRHMTDMGNVCCSERGAESQRMRYAEGSVNCVIGNMKRRKQEQKPYDLPESQRMWYVEG